MLFRRDKSRPPTWVRRRSAIGSFRAQALGGIVLFAAFLSFLLGGVGLLLALILLFTGKKLLQQGRKMGAVDAETLLGNDPRPPILLLRSFKDDGAKADKGARWTGTFEEILSSVLSRFGPVIAIGRPGEKFPEIGAARLYARDDTWQEVILKHMTQCQLCVFIVGTTPGVAWELRKAIEVLGPIKLLLCLPFRCTPSGWRRLFKFRKPRYWYREQQYEAFRQAIGDMLPTTLPNQLANGYFIWFEPDWTSHVVREGRKNQPASGKVDSSNLAAMLKNLQVAIATVRPRTGFESAVDTLRQFLFLVLIFAAAIGVCVLISYLWPMSP